MSTPEPPPPPLSDFDAAHLVHPPPEAGFFMPPDGDGDADDKGGLTASRVWALVRKTISR